MGAPRIGIVALLAALLASPSEATPAEYRLRVANLDDGAYFHFAERDGHDLATPFVLRRLGPALEQSGLPSGVFVSSRVVVPVEAETARSFAAVEVRPLGPSPSTGQWLEVRWEGKPGERAVWAVRGEGVIRQAVVGVGLRAPSGDLRHYVPFAPGPGDWKVRAARLGLEFVEFWEGHADLWRRFLGPKIDLAAGAAAVVAENPNAQYPDAVFVVIDQPPTPTTYDVVIAWHHRSRGRFNPYLEGPTNTGPGPDNSR